MFHNDNLGRFGANLPRDLDNYVPETGDDWRGMRWDLGPEEEFNAEQWSEFVSKAVKATSQAVAARDAWLERMRT